MSVDRLASYLLLRLQSGIKPHPMPKLETNENVMARLFRTYPDPKFSQLPETTCRNIDFSHSSH